MRESLLLDLQSATISGQSFLLKGSDRPLLVAVHGGGFTAKYFDGPYSLPVAAEAAGFDTVLLDRPGASQSVFKRRKNDVLTDNAEVLNDAIEYIWRAHGMHRPGVFLVGHSIGGAVALLAASLPRRWPLIAVSVAGIGDRPPEPLPFSTSVSDAVFAPRLPRIALETIFMAPGSATDLSLNGLEAASTSPIVEELSAIYKIWPTLLSRTLAGIHEPVQMVLAEFEPLWQGGEAAAIRLRALRTRGSTEVLVWPGVGHCIEYHPAAFEYYSAMLAFAGSARSQPQGPGQHP